MYNLYVLRKTRSDLRRAILVSYRFNMALLKCLIIITLAAIFQIVQCRVDPTIGFISPDIVADIGESCHLT